MRKYFLFTSCFLFFLFACKGQIEPRERGKEKTPTEKEKIQLHFDKDNISCDKGITTGQFVEDGESLTFTFIGKLETGKQIKAWSLNDEEIEGKKDKQLKLKIDSKKARKEKNISIIKIGILFEYVQSELLTIQFDEKSIIATKQSSNESISSGYKAKEGEALKFTTKKDSINIESWTINGIRVDDSSKREFNYTVKKENVNQKGVIEISYIEETYTIEFDETKITAQKVSNNSTVNTKYKAKEGEELRFSFRNNKAEVEYWAVNGKKIDESNKLEFKYIVQKADANTRKVISIAVKEVGKDQITIHFGDDIEKCEWVGTLYNSSVKNGDSIEIGQPLQFTARILDGEKIKKWFVNEKEQVGQKSKVFDYTVKREDIDASLTLKVYCEKIILPKATIKYDPKLISCTNYKGEHVDNESSVYQGQKLTFHAKLGKGSKMKHWIVSKKAQTSQITNMFVYTVNINDGEGEKKEITISYEEVAKVKIQFNDEDIECNLWADSTKVKSGDSIGKGIFLKFKAILKEKEIVKEWKIGGKVLTKGTSIDNRKEIIYKVNENDVDNNGAIQIDMKKTIIEPVNIKFDEDYISCKNADTDIHTNDGVKVGDKLTFEFKTKKLGRGKKFKNWLVKSRVEATSTTFDYVVDKDDSEGGVITVHYELVNLPSISVKFSDPIAECTLDNSEKIITGGIVYEGEKLRFMPKKEVKFYVITTWLVKDVMQTEWSKESTVSDHFDYTVRMEDTDEVLGRFQLRVSCLLKTNIMRMVFNPTKTKCLWFSGFGGGGIPDIFYRIPEEVVNGRYMEIGSKVKFDATLPAGMKVKEWRINDNKAEESYKHKWEGSKNETFHLLISSSELVEGSSDYGLQEIKVEPVFELL